MAHPLSFREVTAANWSEFEQLFESKGGPKSCWCMAWRASTKEAKHTDGRSRKAAMKQRVRSNTPVGLLAYSDQEPVAWCSIAPRSTYRRLVSDETPEAHRGSGGTCTSAGSYHGRSLSRGRRLTELPVHGFRVGIYECWLFRSCSRRKAAPCRAVETVNLRTTSTAKSFQSSRATSPLIEATQTRVASTA
jgi:hypothetical protein